MALESDAAVPASPVAGLSPGTTVGSVSQSCQQPPDAFDAAGDNPDPDDPSDPTRASVDLDDLPIELVTLTDSFIQSLDAKVHPHPPNIESLSRLFQQFYASVSSHAATHISALASIQSRESSPPSSLPSISSAASRLRSKASSIGARDKPSRPTPAHQLISASELADRRRARRALEAKRSLLEEAVERRLCEGLYDRIYRHRSTQDEALDDKLRSKTAALALVGIGPVDLGIDLDPNPAKAADASMGEAEKSLNVGQALSEARSYLTLMSQSRYPLGKLNQLKAAHKSIVDTLARFHPSASADEVMPMLIYTLITLPPQDLHLISDLSFIQHFRWEAKLTGEAAYCLTNLEAAVSFLQTVDLPTLRADEHPSGPPKTSSGSATPRAETFPPAYAQVSPETSPGDKAATATSARKSSSPSSLRALPSSRNRRLSDLVNSPAQALGAASDAVFSTADQGLKTLSSGLGDSYSYLVGKLRERQPGPRGPVAVPRTLDDARKLVSTPPPDEDDSMSGASSTLGPDDADPPAVPPSVAPKPTAAAAAAAATSSLASVPTPAVLNQMRSLGSSLNPMARLSNMAMIRGFGRTASSPKEVPVRTADGGDLATAFPDIAAVLPPKEPPPKMAPPIRRFVEARSPDELRLGDVVDLLRDYRRLAAALDSMGLFADGDDTSNNNNGSSSR